MEGISSSWQCPVPSTTLFVWDNGDVSYCGRTAPKGSLLKSTVADFYTSPMVERDTQRVAYGDYEGAGCMPTCNIRAAANPDEVASNYLGLPQRHDGEAVARSGANDGERPLIFFRQPPSAAASRFADIPRQPSERTPTLLQLQLSNYCALRCQFCCFGTIDPQDKKARRTVMSEAVLDRLRDIYPALERIELLGGELFDLPYEGHPLRKIFNDVRVAGNSNLRVKIVTNGQNLTQRWIDFLLDYNFVDLVSFSVDSVDPGVYAETRLGGSLHKLFESIQRLQRSLDERGLESPRIYWTCLLGLHTYRGIPEFVEKALRFGVARIDFQQMNSMGDLSFYARNNLFEPHNTEHLAQLHRLLSEVQGIVTNQVDIMRMIESYLRKISGGRAAMTKVSSHWLMQLDTDSHIDALSESTVVRQSFRASQPVLHRIHLCFATFLSQHNVRRVSLAVEQADGGVVALGHIDAQAIKDNAWIKVDVGAVRVIVGDTYWIVLRAPFPFREGNDITVRCSCNAKIPHGELEVSGRRRSGSLAMMLS